jgi:hypothetical protein
VAGALWGWGVNRTRPVTTGDRCVVIVLTDTPSKWTRYLRAWERDRVEVAITTEWLGSCGAMGMIDDPVDYNDLLLFIVDLSGWKMIGDYDLSPDFPQGVPRRGHSARRWVGCRAAGGLLGGAHGGGGVRVDEGPAGVGARRSAAG